MRRLRGVAALLIALGIGPAWADDLTDSILGIDPRLPLESGTGAAFDDVFHPEVEPSPLSEIEADEAANEWFSGDYSDLRSPLLAPGEGSPDEALRRDAGVEELPSTLDESTLDLPSP